MWPAVISALAGIWLMVAPALFDFNKDIADNAHVVGPMIAACAIIAIWECTRNVRFFNMLLALWLIAAPWVLQYQHTIATLNDYAVAVLVIALSVMRRKRKYRFGGGWPAAWKNDTLDVTEAAAVTTRPLNRSSGQMLP